VSVERATVTVTGVQPPAAPLEGRLEPEPAPEPPPPPAPTLAAVLAVAAGADAPIPPTPVLVMLAVSVTGRTVMILVDVDVDVLVVVGWAELCPAPTPPAPPAPIVALGAPDDFVMYMVMVSVEVCFNVVVTTMVDDPVPSVYVRVVSPVLEPPTAPDAPALPTPVPVRVAATFVAVGEKAVPVLTAAAEAREEDMDSAAVTGQIVVVTAIVSVTM